LVAVRPAPDTVSACDRAGTDRGLARD